MDDIFGPLEQAGIVRVLCHQCHAPVIDDRFRATRVTLSWSGPDGDHVIEGFLCPECADDLMARLSVVREGESGGH